MKQNWGERRQMVKSREFCLLLNEYSRYPAELVDGHLEETVRLQVGNYPIQRLKMAHQTHLGTWTQT